MKPRRRLPSLILDVNEVLRKLDHFFFIKRSAGTFVLFSEHDGCNLFDNKVRLIGLNLPCINFKIGSNLIFSILEMPVVHQLHKLQTKQVFGVKVNSNALISRFQQSLCKLPSG